MHSKLIPGFGPMPTEAGLLSLGGRLQNLADEAVGVGVVEVFHDRLRWYVRGGTDEQRGDAVDYIAEPHRRRGRVPSGA